MKTELCLYLLGKLNDMSARDLDEQTCESLMVGGVLKFNALKLAVRVVETQDKKIGELRESIQAWNDTYYDLRARNEVIKSHITECVKSSISSTPADMKTLGKFVDLSMVLSSTRECAFSYLRDCGILDDQVNGIWTWIVENVVLNFNEHGSVRYKDDEK